MQWLGAVFCKNGIPAGEMHFRSHREAVRKVGLQCRRALSPLRTGVSMDFVKEGIQDQHCTIKRLKGAFACWTGPSHLHEHEWLP